MSIDSEPVTAGSPPAEGRRYGGADADERRDRRRVALIDAGLELFGELGYANVSVKRVCDRAGLTQRYFYESFTDRVGLLIAVYDHCVEVARDAAVHAAGHYLRDGSAVPAESIADEARAALGALFHSLALNPHRARVMLVEVVGVDPAVETVRLRAIHGWADLLLMLAMGGTAATPRQRLAAIGLIGAATQLLVDWYFSSVAPDSGGDPIDAIDLPTMLDVCVDMFVATYTAILS